MVSGTQIHVHVMMKTKYLFREESENWKVALHIERPHRLFYMASKGKGGQWPEATGRQALFHCKTQRSNSEVCFVHREGCPREQWEGLLPWGHGVQTLPNHYPVRQKLESYLIPQGHKGRKRQSGEEISGYLPVRPVSHCSFYLLVLILDHHEICIHRIHYQYSAFTISIK